MCHWAPVLRIHSTASRTRRVGIGLRPGRAFGTFFSGKCSRIRSPCSSRRFNTRRILRHYMPQLNDFEIGSRLLTEPMKIDISFPDRKISEAFLEFAEPL